MTISGWSRPANQQITVVGGQTTQATGTYTATDTSTAVIQGTVSEVDSQGNPRGSLSNAVVRIIGLRSTTTNSQGHYQFEGIAPGTCSIEFEKAGYYSETREINLVGGEARVLNLSLTKEPATSDPVLFNFSSPDGKHFVDGMPNEIHFSTKVDWNGSPGTVRFLVAGEWQSPAITELGGGKALAELSVHVPNVLYSCSQLVIEVTNGEGKTKSLNMGVHFSPLFGMIPWYENTFEWISLGSSLSYSEETSRTWDYHLPSDDLGLSIFVGYEKEIKYNLFSATLIGSLGGSGGLGFTVPSPTPSIKILGEGKLGPSGSLAISLAGCNEPTITPSWTLSGDGKFGIEAPVVLVLDAVVPGLGSAFASLPGINALKLQLYELIGGDLSGEYEALHKGDCLLGSTSNTGSIYSGLEGKVMVEVSKKNAVGVYVGGKGTYDLEICPDLSWDGYTGTIYAGAFAQAFGLEKDIAVAREISWNFNNNTARSASITALNNVNDSNGSWQPIGKMPLTWGVVNHLSASRFLAGSSPNALTLTAGSVEESIMENVIRQAHPAIISQTTGSKILFALHDTEKPWYAATDIAMISQEGNNSPVMNRITDDLSAEFNPEITLLNQGNLLGAWTRVDGDISGVENPDDVVPYLEIVASFYDGASDTWGLPVQLTDNDVVDHDPLPIHFGDQIGIVWIQNQGPAMPGNATWGDSLMYAEWNGNSWNVPVTLWSAQKGIQNFSFAADDQGQGHLAMVVDEDGDNDTTSDQELYYFSTQNSIWQAGERLTNNSAQDDLPVLMIPNSGSPMLVWSSGATLMYSFMDSWNPRQVYAQETLANEAPTLDGVTMPGGAAIAYSVQSAEGMDIVAAFYDASLDQWSLPRPLTQDEHAESSLDMAFDGNELVMSYLKTQTLRENIEVELGGQMQTIENVPQPGRTDLYMLRHALGHDLAVLTGSITFEPSNPGPGIPVQIKCSIENRGDLTAQDISVLVYDGDPQAGGSQIGQTSIPELIAGSSQEIIVPWDVPADLNAHLIFVSVDPELIFDDRDRNNNNASAWTVLPDLFVETSMNDPLSGTEEVLTAKIVNNGVIPSGNSSVCWRLGSESGELLGCKEIQAVMAGGSREQTLVWDHSAFGQEKAATVYVSVDSNNVVLESDESNNTVLQSFVSAGDNDGILDNEDNCPNHYNPNQVDTYPPGGNGIGNACDCEGNFTCDADVDGSDASTFKADFGRSTILHPCIAGDTCNGDFSCDGDVDGSDASLFKADFGRSAIQNPCPACFAGADWCRYQ